MFGKPKPRLRLAASDRRRIAWLLWALLWPSAALGSADERSGDCEFSTAESSGRADGLVVGADLLLPDRVGIDYGVHLIGRGIGDIGAFSAVREAHPGAAVLDCRGKAVLSPGFVNPHEHSAYSFQYPPEGLAPRYAHRDQWRSDTGSTVGDGLSVRDPYYRPSEGIQKAALVAMELRHLLGGATTIAGAGGVSKLARNVRGEDLGREDFRAEIEVFPFSPRAMADLEQECAGGKEHKFDIEWEGEGAFVAHVGEGRPGNCAAKREVELFLQLVGQRANRRYAIVHGVAAGERDFEIMRRRDVTLVWSPRSNLALYGATIDLRAAIRSSVRLALGTDWSPTGSFNMREEADCARRVAEASGIDIPKDRMWRMVTANAAYALGLEDKIGALRPGLRADLLLLKRDGRGSRHGAVLTASHEEILAIWVDGRVVAVSPPLRRDLGGGACKTVRGVVPELCVNLSEAKLRLRSFERYVKARTRPGSRSLVGLVGVAGQAPCDVSGIRSATPAANRAVE